MHRSVALRGWFHFHVFSLIQSFLLLGKGVLMTFGDNSYGQLGIKKMNEQEMHSNAPVPICLPAEEKISAYSCGGSHTALVTGKLVVSSGLIFQESPFIIASRPSQGLMFEADFNLAWPPFCLYIHVYSDALQIYSKWCDLTCR